MCIFLGAYCNNRLLLSTGSHHQFSSIFINIHTTPHAIFCPRKTWTKQSILSPFIIDSRCNQLCYLLVTIPTVHQLINNNSLLTIIDCFTTIKWSFPSTHFIIRSFSAEILLCHPLSTCIWLGLGKHIMGKIIKSWKIERAKLYTLPIRHCSIAHLPTSPLYTEKSAMITHNHACTILIVPLIGSSLFIPEQHLFSQDLNDDLINCLWNRPQVFWTAKCHLKQQPFNHSHWEQKAFDKLFHYHNHMIYQTHNNFPHSSRLNKHQQFFFRRNPCNLSRCKRAWVHHDHSHLQCCSPDFLL